MHHTADRHSRKTFNFLVSDVLPETRFDCTLRFTESSFPRFSVAKAVKPSASTVASGLALHDGAGCGKGASVNEKRFAPCEKERVNGSHYRPDHPGLV
jgi:hypothetical protein